MNQYSLLFLGFVKYSKLDQAKYLSRDLFNSVKDTFTFPMKVEANLRDTYSKALAQARHQLESLLPNTEFSKEEREVLSAFFWSFEHWSKTLSSPNSVKEEWSSIKELELLSSNWESLLQVIENSTSLGSFFKLDDQKKRLFERVSQMKKEEIIPSFEMD